MGAYLLDTHAAVWLLEGSPKLSDAAKAAIEAEETVALSDISLLELAMIARRGVILLQPDLASGLKRVAEQLTVLPISARVAAEAVTIALPQRDPFDRVIAATARAHQMTLITKDRQITEAGVVATLW